MEVTWRVEGFGDGQRIVTRALAGEPYFHVYGERITASMRGTLADDLCAFLNGAAPKGWLLHMERLGDLRVRTRLGNTLEATSSLYADKARPASEHQKCKALMDALLADVAKRTNTAA